MFGFEDGFGGMDKREKGGESEVVWIKGKIVQFK